MNTKNLDPNQSAIADANRSRASFSGHGNSLGAAGYREASHDPENSEYLAEPGYHIAITPKKEDGSIGFDNIKIGVAWDNIQMKDAGFFERLFKKVRHVGVDLDLGCLYEMKDGTRGCLQAFGEKFGRYNNPPYIILSEDDRTGDKEGDDETLQINGEFWDQFERLLVYIYIYDGAPSWSDIKPRVIVDIPGENDLVVTLGAHNDALALCAVGGLENVRGGIKLTNYTEYFPGHAEMDRAFGFGLEWEDGQKD